MLAAVPSLESLPMLPGARPRALTLRSAAWRGGGRRLLSGCMAKLLSRVFRGPAARQGRPAVAAARPDDARVLAQSTWCQDDRVPLPPHVVAQDIAVHERLPHVLDEALGLVSKRGACRPIPGIPGCAPPKWNQFCRRNFRTGKAIADLFGTNQFSYPCRRISQPPSSLILTASLTLGLGL